MGIGHTGTLSSNVYTKGLRLDEIAPPLSAGSEIKHYYDADGTPNDRLRRLRYQKLWDGDLMAGTVNQTMYYVYNGAGRVAHTFSHGGSNNDIEWTANTASGVYGNWDRFGRTLKQRWFRSSTTHDEFNYTYDYASNRLTRDVPSALYATDDLDQLYFYDDLQRLEKLHQGTLSGGTIGSTTEQQIWGLDQLGNWATLREHTGYPITLEQQRFHNAANEIDGNGGNSITSTMGTPNWADPQHDAAGNMITMPRPLDPTNNYTPVVYDAWDRLISVNIASSNVLTNEYDGNHHRIRKVVNGGDAFDYYYNDKWQMIAEAKNGSTYALYAWHVYYIDALAVRFRASDKYLFLHDANFNITAAYDVLSGSGTYRTVTERYAYTPYGEVTVLNGDFTLDSSGMGDGLSDIDNVHLYTGRERDPETGLQLNRYRWYHALLGRWTSWDPIGYAGGMNLYGYVHSNPIKLTDAIGLSELYWGFVDLIPPGPKPIDVILIPQLKPVPQRPTVGKPDRWIQLPDGTWVDILDYLTDQRKPECKKKFPNAIVESVESKTDAIGKVNKALGQDECISELSIVGHGGPGEFAVGPFVGDPNPQDLNVNIPNYKKFFGRFRFCEDCTITIYSCRVGEDGDPNKGQYHTLGSSLGSGIANSTGCKVKLLRGTCSSDYDPTNPLPTPTPPYMPGGFEEPWVVTYPDPE